MQTEVPVPVRRVPGSEQARPVPLGLTPAQVLRLLDAAWAGSVAGLCVSEFLPAKDQDDRSLALLVWLLEWVLLRRHESA